MRRTLTFLLLLLLLLLQQTSGTFIFDQARRALTKGFPRHGQGCFSAQQRPTWLYERFLKYSQCGDFPDVENADRTIGCDACKTPTLELTCLDGFYFSDGSNSKMITCQCDGWVGIEACEEISCDPPLIPNAALDRAEPYNYPDAVDVTCMTGFFLTDGDGSYTTECRADGTWTRTDPCVRKLCAEMEQNNTKLVDNLLPELAFPFSIPVPCEDGYLTSDAATCYLATCLQDGSWTTTGSCDYDADDACPLTPLTNTMQTEIPLTVNEGTFYVECAAGQVLPTGGTSYTATCDGGTWDVSVSCGISSCEAALEAGLDESGVYSLVIDGTLVDVYCEQELDGGGWMVIQQRESDTVDFHLKEWVDYKAGFGDPTENFWLGLDNIYFLTQGMDTQLKIEMREDTTEKFANYGVFYISDSSTDYTLTEDMYSGDAGDGLDEVDGSPFSTPDDDNDACGSDCAGSVTPSGWWMKCCHDGDLNGEYGNDVDAKGVNWFDFNAQGRTTSLDFVRMMVKSQPTP